ncbi:MAG: OmpH family outer membrane protein [Bacteroidota bacterium]
MQEETFENPQGTEETIIYDQQNTIQEKPAGTKPPFFTFNFNTLLGLVLLVALAVLYVLFFNSRKNHELPAMLNVPKVSGKSTSVVYVNLDSLNAHYDYVKILRRDLESTGKRLQSEVLAEQSALEKEGAEFQRQVAANIIPEDKAKVIYEQLMQKSNALDQKKQHYTQQVADQEMNMNLRLIDSVTTFLRRFNRQYRFDYILGYKTGGEILIANDTMDITRSVMEMLNAEYQQRKK